MLGTPISTNVLQTATDAFGTLFNNIIIQRKESDGTVVKKIRVPIRFADKKKVSQELFGPVIADEAPKTKLTVPCISFDLTAMEMDSTRKLNTVQRFTTNLPEFAGTLDSWSSGSTVSVSSTLQTPYVNYVQEYGTMTGRVMTIQDESFVITGVSWPSVTLDRNITSTPSAKDFHIIDTETKTVSYAPVPYLLTYTLSIFTDSNTDLFLILANIIPYFRPTQSVTVKDCSAHGLKTDLQFTMSAPTKTTSGSDGKLEETQDRSFDITFTCSGVNFYMPTQYLNLIREVIINTYAVDDVNSTDISNAEGFSVSTTATHAGTAWATGSNTLRLLDQKVSTRSEAYVNAKVELSLPGDANSSWVYVIKSYDPVEQIITLFGDLRSSGDINLTQWDYKIYVNKDGYNRYDAGTYHSVKT